MPTPPQIDESFMRRALRLAMNGRGHVEPNPMVACVLVKEGRVIGEGFHAKYGGPHAEPTALANCTESPEGATAYVTLEPCCHTNKKTPPCAPRLIEAKVKRVVIGCLDPNPDVNGKGVAILRAAGITVDGPVLEGEAKQLISPFLLRTHIGRPLVTLKWAETADGKVAGPRFSRLQITGPAASEAVHALRARSDGIVVGINTVITDDPLLTAHGQTSVENRTIKQPIRFVLDSQILIPETSQLVRTAHEVPVVIVCNDDFFDPLNERLRSLIEAGVIFVAGPAAESHVESLTAFVDLFGSDTLEDVRLEPFESLLVEPGPTLARSFFDSGLVDRVWVFRSPLDVDDATAPDAVPVPEKFVKTGDMQLGSDVLSEYLNPNSPAFFAAVPSADLILARDAIVGSASADGLLPS